ncbi:MAG: hypothetical protein AAGA80_06505 [Cyanobacteria bacterium P01_F01_bin.143]
MSERQISLNEKLYKDLLAAAESSGVTPEEWIAAQLPKTSQVIKKEVQWQQLQKAFGTWRDNDELDQIFTEIDRQRHFV